MNYYFRLNMNKIMSGIYVNIRISLHYQELLKFLWTERCFTHNKGIGCIHCFF